MGLAKSFSSMNYILLKVNVLSNKEPFGFMKMLMSSGTI